MEIVGVIVGVVAVAFFVWLVIPEPASPSSRRTTNEAKAELIDPSDSRQIGMLMGMMGGSVSDAAVARFALQRFEEIHGRKATTQDAGIVAGLIRSIQL
jgi:hypothetical protein